jgi:hypothetical protein
LTVFDLDAFAIWSIIINDRPRSADHHFSSHIHASRRTCLEDMSRKHDKVSVCPWVEVKSVGHMLADLDPRFAVSSSSQHLRQS